MCKHLGCGFMMSEIKLLEATMAQHHSFNWWALLLNKWSCLETYTSGNLDIYIRQSCKTV